MCSCAFLPVNACRVCTFSTFNVCKCMRVHASTWLPSRTCQCVSRNCFNVTLLVAKNFCTFTMCRSKVKVILQIGASLSTYLCTHYMYVHMALCHDCTYIWVDACLYKLFLYNLSCLHRLVHVSLSVHSSICYSISKDKITICNW